MRYLRSSPVTPTNARMVLPPFVAMPDNSKTDINTRRIKISERLQALMLFRVVVVTIFLGSTIALDISALASLSDRRNLVLLALIVATYAMTIVYALILRSGYKPRVLAAAQIGTDLLIITMFVLTTGNLDSVFLFMFHINIISAAIALGRRGAVYTTAATLLVFCAILAPVATGYFPNILIETQVLPRAFQTVIFEIAISASASVLIALLAGSLTARLGAANVEIKQQQVDIADLRALNRNILASVSSGLLTAGRSGKIIFFNQAAETITGLRNHNVLGKTVESVFPDFARIIKEAEIKSAQDTRFEQNFLRPDGKDVFLGFSVSALRDSDGKDTGRIVIFQDLTTIQKLQEQVKRAERLAAVGELSAAIAHEIRNPLASISGSVELLKDNAQVSDEDDMLMQIVLREVGRLDKLITDFLAYCSPRALNLQEVSLPTLMNDVLRLFKNRRSETAIDIELFDNSNAEKVVRVDPEAIQQILWNLLNNAADAPADKIRVEVSQSDTHWFLAIEDNGPGINAALRERIFEPFFTTKQAGTGLGLATIYRLIEEHDGNIAIEAPHVLSGARFEIQFPAL